MQLFFLRHGIAEDLASSDFARELTKRGRRRVARSAKVMKRLGIQPKTIFTSPRLRALQTAEIVAAELGMQVKVTEALNFGFDLDDVRALSRGLSLDDEVMFVGHNPDMRVNVNELTGSAVSMKKGGLARVDVYYREARHGELIWLIAPKVFDALAQRLEQSSDKLASSPPEKAADSSAPLHPLMKNRWSPVGFDAARPIDNSTLLSVLEAGRWAASSYNLQPWRFIIAPRDSKAEFDKMLSVLKEGNQIWARDAAALMLAVIHKHSAPDRLNPHASHDLGQAIAQMTLQALHHDVYTHQMAGFFPDKARELYRIPEEYEAFTAIAFGYRAADMSHLSEAHQQRDSAVRQRQPLREMTFSGLWGQPADILESGETV